VFVLYIISIFTYSPLLSSVYFIGHYTISKVTDVLPKVCKESQSQRNKILILKALMNKQIM
jgi:hypothetical protein